MKISRQVQWIPAVYFSVFHILILDDTWGCWPHCYFPHGEEMTWLNWLIRVFSPPEHRFAQLLTCDPNKHSIHLADWYGHCGMWCVVPIWNASYEGRPEFGGTGEHLLRWRKRNALDLSCHRGKYTKKAEWGKLWSSEFPELATVKVSQLLETNYMSQMNLSLLS